MQFYPGNAQTTANAAATAAANAATAASATANYARATNITRVSSTSGTWVDTQTSVTINKQSSSTAIYITIEDAMYAGSLGGHRLVRGTTVLVESSGNSFGKTGSSTWYGRQSITYVDNISSTGNINYRTQFRRTANTDSVVVNNNNSTRCTAVAIEI